MGRARVWALALGLAALHGAGRAGVVVVPRCRAALPGRACAFRVLVDGGPGGPCAWEVLDPAGGEISQDGLFRAADPADPLLVRIRATCGTGSGEARILVLPQQPFAVVEAVLGPGWIEAFSWDVPFRDGDAPAGPEPVAAWPQPPVLAHPASWPVAGQGMPLTLRWLPPPEAEAALLTWLEGGRPERRDVTGLDQWTFVPHGAVEACALEVLKHLPGPGGGWASHREDLWAWVRGLVPFAGNPLDPPGHGDGQGLSARFSAPLGLACVNWGTSDPPLTAVADPGQHVARLVTGRGATEACLGLPGQPGHRDGAESQARFDRPTFVAVLPVLRWTPGAPPGFARDFLVADSGNHALRKVEGGRGVFTFAGTPGEAGHRDGDDRLRAAFREPRGLAVDDMGTVYVADRGNHVIRRIEANGRVTTLAGRPGEPGSTDGAGDRARFHDLKGLALARHGDLWAADGHAVRRVTVHGVVTTPLGDPGEPGFRDLPGLTPGGPPLPAKTGPCLDDPWGLAVDLDDLFIADRGNHAVRHYNFRTGELSTVVGGPDVQGVRWGLLRDGIPGPLPAEFAALDAPMAVASLAGSDLLVADGPSLVRICRPPIPALRPLVEVRLEPRTAKVGAEFRVEWLVRLRRCLEPEQRPIGYVVEFVNPDGSVAERKGEEGLTGTGCFATGVFTQAGAGRVRLRGTTGDGQSVGAERTLEIAP